MEHSLFILDSGATTIYNKNVKKNKELGLYIPRWRVAKWKEAIACNREGGFNLFPSQEPPNKFMKIAKRGERHGPGTHLINRRKLDYSFYKTKEFKEFREAYIKFVKKNDKYMFGYINLDVINNAEMTYQSQKYMEERGCHPFPVFHIGNDIKWLKRYLDEGYKFICLGGISPDRFSTVAPTLNEIWSKVLTDDKGLPLVKIHGLACTSYDLLINYPWYSVDSASWLKSAVWGAIYVPRKKNNKFSFAVPPFGMAVSNESPRKKIGRRHLDTISKAEREHIEEWLKIINVPIGGIYKGKEISGIINDYEYRMMANLFYFQALSDSLPRWPWAFESTIPKKGLFE